MAESYDFQWSERLDIAQEALRGKPAAKAALDGVVAALPRGRDLLSTASYAGHFAYFLALLREMEMDPAYARALEVARRWVEAELVPVRHRCWVHTRLATVFDEGGDGTAARMALDSALQNARTRLEKAYTFAHYGVFSARHDEWPQAVAYARKAQRHSRRSDEGPQWLEVRMRTVSVLFLAALEEADPEAARGLARSLETVCQQQIDRWGPDHPRALEALVTMASARHEIARVDGDLAGMDRLTDVLAVAAQRTSTTLGARHPQAKAVQAVLARVHEATERARRQQVAAEPIQAQQPQAPAPVLQPPLWQQPDAGIPEGELTTAVLELLVHGFDGTSPEEMLGVPQTVRITGDERAAIHRRVDDVDAESDGEGSAGMPVPEAYVWRRSRYEYLARASWLVLLPFTLINLAHWMLPAARGHARAVRLYGLLVRLTSLTLTVLLVAASCEVTLDLAAWQCAGSRGCVQEHPWLRLLSPDVSGGGWWSQPGRRLAVAAVVPTALIGLLWWLSFRTWSAYESQQPVPRNAGSDDDTGHGALSRPGFWYGRRLVARLRAAHIAAGFLTVAAAVGSSAGRYDRAAGHRAGLEVLSWVFDAALGVGAAVVFWVVCRRGRSERRLDQQLDTLVMRCLPAAALALLALAMLYAGWSRPDWRSAGRLPGGAAFSVIAVVQCAAVIALGAVARLLYRIYPDPRTALRGLAGPAIALLACALGALLSGGTAQRAGDWLNDADQSIAGPPALLTWQASAAPPLLLVLLALFAGLAWRTRQLSRQERARVEADYPGEIRDTVRTRRIAGTRARATLVDRGPLVIGLASGGSLALCAAALTGAFATEKGPSEAAQEASGLVQHSAEAAQALGSWLTVLGLLVFLAWSHHAYQGRTNRRTISILDMGAFWPRAAHPLAPPCYAERAVPDLAWRITTWNHSTRGRLVLSAHGQGSVLAAAAISQLSPSLRRGVALQTYGSPLERIYGRWFPAHFGLIQLTALHTSIEDWRNLYRLTDPVGGPIRLAGYQGPAVDHAPLMDPLTLGRTTQHPLPAPILGNVGYQTDPVFAEEEARLVARLRPAMSPRSASATTSAAAGSDARTGPPEPPA